jgi:hypothetical protein
MRKTRYKYRSKKNLDHKPNCPKILFKQNPWLFCICDFRPIKQFERIAKRSNKSCKR